ncbi:MAG: hypothetical protein COU44_01025 [Candidatus Nealsonbacteria bacterium CG10_big_fil_rev_8_21_14_0_10_40_24]|nr:MAG: hypothetical protein COU44_01025 [Candidatus Nealsonbacteria bacterium CG10_big_fil_rev_8_21_14_0_10_40_24]
MTNESFLATYSTTFLVLIILLALWEAVWKAIALWKAARNSHLAWFIFILILNTAGILPIIYIFIFAKKK